MAKSDGVLVISINTGEPIDIISGIKSLRALTTSTSKPVEKEKGAFIFGKVTKKDKKEKKKNKGSDFGDTEFMRRVSNALDDDDEHHDGDEDDDRNIKFLDADSIYGEDEETDLTDEISRAQKRNYKKKENDFEKKFDEELTILYDLLEEVNKFGKGLEKKYSTLESSKVRGISKYTNDLIVSILSSKTSKLQIIREIASIKKIIQELKFKSEKESKDKSGETSRDQIAGAYLSKLLGGMGRSKFVQDFGGGGFNVRSRNDEDEDDAEVLDALEARRGDSDWQRDRIHDMIEQRLDDEEAPNRSSESDAYVKYENSGVNICIKRCVDDGTWEFVAVDRDKQELDDYPLPKRKNVGTVRFSQDGNRATDGRGMSYRVIEYLAPL
jgi:hypothetical protein